MSILVYSFRIPISLSTENAVRCVRMMPRIVGGRRMVEESREITAVHRAATCVDGRRRRWADGDPDIEAGVAGHAATGDARHDVSEIESICESEKTN